MFIKKITKVVQMLLQNHMDTYGFPSITAHFHTTDRVKYGVHWLSFTKVNLKDMTLVENWNIGTCECCFSILKSMFSELF